MFKKILVANRGEIAVRVIRACRDMGIDTVALYAPSERDSLHVRLADECAPVVSEQRYGDMDEVLEIAARTGADAVHPGYGFLAENPQFARRCADAGITFIGPPADVIETLQNKINCMEVVRSAGFNVPLHSEMAATSEQADLLASMADDLGYPLVIKACSGGRGRGSRVVVNHDMLLELAPVAYREAAKIYDSDRLYLEKVITPSHYVAVQIMADQQGNMIHLGEREGSLLWHNQKLIEESPAPCLTPGQRDRLWQAAVEIAQLFDYQNVGTVEFLVDGEGRFYFTEIKARIQIEHPVSEMVSGVDIVHEQIRIAAGLPLHTNQAGVKLQGWAMQCRINAEDPWNNFLPSPGTLERFRLPGGPGVRVDTYGYVGCHVPVRYDSLLANVVTWADTRCACITRAQRALEDFKIVGVQTNLAMHLPILADPKFVNGDYDTNYLRYWRRPGGLNRATTDERLRRDLAAATAVAFMLRHHSGETAMPARFTGGWHRSSRRLPV
ncbi:MAG: ATP-grasp domain-containing protein [Caldilineaceae bacterium]|nr:ATP-grasp domain-containing protein [Caldilineaceae bacterium]